MNAASNKQYFSDSGVLVIVNCGYLSLLLKAFSSRRDDFRFLNKILKLSETLEECTGYCITGYYISVLVELMILDFLTYYWCNSSLISKVRVLVFQKFFQVLKVFNAFSLSKGQITKQYMSNVCFKLKIFLYKNSTLNLSNYEAAFGTRLFGLSAVLHAN